MNLRKKILSLFTIILFVTIALSQNMVYATQVETGEEVYMGIIKLMNNSTPNFGYSINDPNEDNGVRIWNILQYKSKDSSDFVNKNIFCVKEGIGFTQANVATGTVNRVAYNIFYDMKSQRNDIKTQNEVLKNLVEKTISEDGKNYNRYDALLAVLDMLYLPIDTESPTQEQRNEKLNERKELIFNIVEYAKKEHNSFIELIAKAFNFEGDVVDLLNEKNPTKYELTDYALTEDEIKAVEQAVIWYFTNYGEGSKYDQTSSSNDWFFYTQDGNTYESLSQYNNQKGRARTEQAKMLYKYMIEQAKENASKYTNSTSSTNSPVSIDTKVLNGEEAGNNYIVGPIHMTELNAISSYKIGLEVKNNNSEIENYKLLKADKTTEMPEGTTVKSLIGKDFYISIPKSQVESLSVNITVDYNKTNKMQLWVSTAVGGEQPLVEVEKKPDSETTELTFKPNKPEEKPFDLKLIKSITAVNNQNVPERIESIDVSKLNTFDSNGKMITTADYKLNKNPVTVKKGDIVTYTFRIYNEGTIDGYAQKITEDVPEGLQFLYSTKENDELKADTTLSDEEKEAIEFNQTYLWGDFKYDANGNIKEISSDYLSKEKETNAGDNLIKAFGRNDGKKTQGDLKYKELKVKFKVISENVSGITIRNEAAITDDCDKKGNQVNDRDSEPENWPGKDDHTKYQDDEDYDNIILQSFDLALRKFIIAVSEDDKIERSEELRNTDGSYTRGPVVDTSKLNTLDEEGKLITTAIYNHTKEPVEVRKNDYIVYMLRVYNEGDIDGYAAEIKDHLPPYLEFVDGEYNKQYGWTVSEDGRTVTTKYLENDKINKTEVKEQKIVLSYKEVPIMCKVKDTVKTGEKVTNIADITKYLDDKKQPVIDRDSQENNVELPKDEKLPNYKDDEKGNYVPGQQDDDDFEKVIIKRFDLALRKFITAIGDKEVNTRIPQVKYENGKISYEHSKEPLMVVTNNIVTYTIRVFNEGQIAGYAKEVTDDIPAGLEFLPDNELNKTMRWKMIDAEGKETTEVAKAVKITTDYLSKEQEKVAKGNLLKAFDPNAEINDKNPDYKDVQVAFKVTEPNSSDKIIINSAQISEDSDEKGNPVDDDDSIPNEWNEGEDDQDKEYIKLVEFDLALRKWVTQAIVIENGKETVTQTGHQPWDEPEAVVKVELHRKKLNQVTVKFRYSIRVYNQGDIAGYAKEVTDYVPQGLKFIAEENPGWKDEGNNVISTRLLENTLLQPGEYADVEVLLTWINNENNMGVMNNTAEISEDDNEYGVPDKDSTPDNQKKGEDDIDDAPVMLSLSTGQIRIYFTLGFVILFTIAGGVILIKKFVL